MAKDLRAAVDLSDGVRMPLFGLGTAGAMGLECRDAVAHALRSGYRLVDTAQLYRRVLRELDLSIIYHCS